MTLQAVLLAAVGIVTLRQLGMFVLRGTAQGGAAEKLLRLVPVSVVAAVVALNTLTTKGNLVIDARAAGAAAAAIAVWRRANLVVVLVVAAVTTALVRAIS